jgi:toxin ParE1/3/4
VRADLVDILTYIADESGSIAVAQGFVAQLRNRCRELASMPGTLGRARPELHADLRSVAHKGYVIFLRYAEDRLEVVNILEGHRDVDSLF